MIRQLILSTILSFGLLNLSGQATHADTVVVKLGKSSQVLFTVEDRSDLEILKQYDFQSLFQDIISKIELNDTTPLVKSPDDLFQDDDETLGLQNTADQQDEEDEEEEWSYNRKKRWRTTQSFNFDLGTNNYLSNGKFPDSENAPHAVRPWGSWYLAANSVQRTRVGESFFLEWGVGVSWYNFKFQNNNVLLQKDDIGVSFIRDETPEVSYKKSKLTASYVNISLVPMLDFGGYEYKRRIWDGHHSAFRIGAGPYAGYRIGSHSKVKYKKDSDLEKDKDHDSFYIENFRYGIRLQLGFRSTDLFFNYDMNDLFTEGKGPSLNAFSFGVIF